MIQDLEQKLIAARKAFLAACELPPYDKNYSWSAWEKKQRRASNRYGRLLKLVG